MTQWRSQRPSQDVTLFQSHPFWAVFPSFCIVFAPFRTIFAPFCAISDRSELFSDRFERRTLRKVRENWRKLRENSAKIRESLVVFNVYGGVAGQLWSHCKSTAQPWRRADACSSISRPCFCGTPVPLTKVPRRQKTWIFLDLPPS